MHWCTDCGSALAEAEVEYEDKMSPAIDVVLPLLISLRYLAKFGLTEYAHPISMVIWTTTPWTLPANRALSVAGQLRIHLG